MTVALIYLPAGPGGQKVGVDDYLAAGHSVDELLALVRVHVQKPSKDDDLPEIMTSGRPMRDISANSWGLWARSTRPPSYFREGTFGGCHARRPRQSGVAQHGQAHLQGCARPPR